MPNCENKRNASTLSSMRESLYPLALRVVRFAVYLGFLHQGDVAVTSDYAKNLRLPQGAPYLTYLLPIADLRGDFLLAARWPPGSTLRFKPDKRKVSDGFSHSLGPHLATGRNFHRTANILISIEDTLFHSPTRLSLPPKADRKRKVCISPR